MIVNQVVDKAATDRFLSMRRKDQQRALELLRSLPALRHAPARLLSLTVLQHRCVSRHTRAAEQQQQQQQPYFRGMQPATAVYVRI